MKVFAIILNYNGYKDSLECIKSLQNQRLFNGDLEIVVVDNNSRDKSITELEKLSSIKLIKNMKNRGFAGGMNIGIRYSIKNNADSVLLLNNDVYLENRFLLEITQQPDADIVAPKIYFAPGHEFHKKRYHRKDLGNVIWFAGAKIDWQNIIGTHTGVDEVDRGKFNKNSEIDYASGACMLIKKKVFKKIGLLDEKYFLYLEDMDFCLRAKKAGFKIMLQPKAIAWHKNAQSSGGSGSKAQDFYITRSRLLFALKYAKLKTKLAVFKQILGQSNIPIKRKALLSFLTLDFNEMR